VVLLKCFTFEKSANCEARVVTNKTIHSWLVQETMGSLSADALAARISDAC